MPRLNENTGKKSERQLSDDIQNEIFKLGDKLNADPLNTMDAKARAKLTARIEVLKVAKICVSGGGSVDYLDRTVIEHKNWKSFFDSDNDTKIVKNLVSEARQWAESRDKVNVVEQTKMRPK